MMAKGEIKQPEKKETLATKQAERIKRLNLIRQRFQEFSPRAWVGLLELGGLLILFLINFWLILPFFGQPDQINVFSAPVVPVLVSLTEAIVPTQFGIRIWILAFLSLFPLFFYYFVREVSGRKLVGFIASFLVILPWGPFLPTRVKLGLFAQDGAHVVALTFMPLICLLLLRFLRRGNFWTGLLTALGTTLVALTSPIGVIVLAVFMGVITFSEMLLGQGRLKALRFLVIAFLTIGFSAFWYNPKFVLLTIQSAPGQILVKTFLNLLPISFFLLPLLGVFGFLLFENQPQLQPMFIAFFLTVGFGLFSLGAGVVHPSPSRFVPALGMALAFLIGISLITFFDFLRYSPKLKSFNFGRRARYLLALGLLTIVFGLIFLILVNFSADLWNIDNPQVLGILSEQKVGVWEIREQIGLPENILGLFITSFTVFGVTFLKTRLGI
jgi:hypothetical protein